jgi:hypothetical protein
MYIKHYSRGLFSNQEVTSPFYGLSRELKVLNQVNDELAPIP